MQDKDTWGFPTHRYYLLAALDELDQGHIVEAEARVRSAIHSLDGAEEKRIFPLLERNPDVRSGKKRRFRFIFDPLESDD